jgi:hypothetical protein
MLLHKKSITVHDFRILNEMLAVLLPPNSLMAVSDLAFIPVFLKISWLVEKLECTGTQAHTFINTYTLAELLSSNPTFFFQEGWKAGQKYIVK